MHINLSGAANMYQIWPWNFASPVQLSIIIFPHPDTSILSLIITQQ